MKKPRFLTFTGIDDNTKIENLDKLCNFAVCKNQKIEFGVLVSPHRDGQPRFPKISKAIELINFLKTKNAQISIHVCGNYSKKLMDRIIDDDIESLIILADRVQINLRKHHVIKVIRKTIIKRLLNKPIILQHRDGGFPEKPEGINWLLDRSGGRGVGIKNIPSNKNNDFVGYSGGLNPENVCSIIRKIKDSDNYWLDFETGIRTDNEFDYNKCINIIHRIYEL